jgi:hypothetical protein
MAVAANKAATLTKNNRQSQGRGDEEGGAFLDVLLDGPTDQLSCSLPLKDDVLAVFVNPSDTRCSTKIMRVFGQDEKGFLIPPILRIEPKSDNSCRMPY